MTVKINDRDSEINKLLDDTLKLSFFNDIIASELSKIRLLRNKKCFGNKI